jgi:hypothetical protein
MWINTFCRILIPPFPGSSPGAPASNFNTLGRRRWRRGRAGKQWVSTGWRFATYQVPQSPTQPVPSRTAGSSHGSVGPNLRFPYRAAGPCPAVRDQVGQQAVTREQAVANARSAALLGTGQDLGAKRRHANGATTQVFDPLAPRERDFGSFIQKSRTIFLGGPIIGLPRHVRVIIGKHRSSAPAVYGRREAQMNATGR